jgi:hypothetical protein
VTVLESNAALLDEAKQRVALLTANLPTIVDPASISYSAKTPFKALCFREALIWRMEEFALVSCELYAASRVASAMKMTRGCQENTAAAWYLNELVQGAIDRGDVNGLDERLMRLLLGSKNGVSAVSAVNVLTLVDRVDKKVPGFRKSYDDLSEFVHPNWSGTAMLFSKNDHEKILTEIGKNLRDHTSTIRFGLRCLIGSLIAFEHVYNDISDLMPSLIKLCESSLKSSAV